MCALVQKQTTGWVKTWASPIHEVEKIFVCVCYKIETIGLMIGAIHEAPKQLSFTFCLIFF